MFALDLIEIVFYFSFDNCEVTITNGLLVNWKRWRKRTRRNIQLCDGYVSINWKQKKKSFLIFLWWGECFYVFLFFHNSHMSSSFISSVMKCNIIILLDEHNVANYTVIKLTATICQVWWCIALINTFSYSIKRYPYCLK